MWFAARKWGAPSYDPPASNVPPAAVHTASAILLHPRARAVGRALAGPSRGDNGALI